MPADFIPRGDHHGDEQRGSLPASHFGERDGGEVGGRHHDALSVPLSARREVRPVPAQRAGAPAEPDGGARGGGGEQICRNIHKQTITKV
eukprot:5604297-Pyramimonas_sp.AAC.1